MSEQNLMPVQILDWRELRKGALQGFVKIQLGALEITDVQIMSSDGRRWANLPSKPQIDRDGNVRKENGKTLYTPILKWATKDAGNRFSESVLAALEAKHPQAVG